MKEESKDGQPHYFFDTEKLALALVGHPHLFLEDSPTTPAEFITGERLDHIPLELTNGPVSLQGVVSHISVSTDKTICGIRFLLTGDQFDMVIQFKNERER